MASEATARVWSSSVRNSALGIALQRASDVCFMNGKPAPPCKTSVEAVIAYTRSTGTERLAPIAAASYKRVGATFSKIGHIGALRMDSI